MTAALAYIIQIAVKAIEILIEKLSTLHCLWVMKRSLHNHFQDLACEGSSSSSSSIFVEKIWPTQSSQKLYMQ